MSEDNSRGRSSSVQRAALYTLALIVAMTLTACGSSGDGRMDPSSGQSTATQPAGGSTTLDTDPTVEAGPSNIVDNYDTALCSDWAATDASNRTIVAAYFLARHHADDLTDYELAYEEAITTACNLLGAKGEDVTVKRVADAAVGQLRKTIEQVGG